jgi:uncharacterized oxidoreductase
MKTSGNTVLITGGSAGIGFEIAKLFAVKGNHVIITGRNKQRLEQAAAQLPQVTTVLSDVTGEKDVILLADRLRNEFPALNILINNAGLAAVYTLTPHANAFEKAGDEMLTNYLSVIRLTERLLPGLAKQPAAAIVNVTSVVAIAPYHGVPTYAASKAALHSYTQSLRLTLAKTTAIKVFELMPPLVNTAFSKEIGGENGIAPAIVASNLLEAMEKDEYEIHVGNTAQIYELYLSSPEQALSAMNAG